MAGPWEDYKAAPTTAETGKPWEKYRTPAPATGPKTTKEDAAAAITRQLSAGAEGVMSADFADEATRVFSAANEKWIAPAVGGLVDLVGDPIAAGVNAMFGTEYDSDVTGALREGMRGIGASGGPDYQPKTELGQLASNVIGAGAAALPLAATAGQVAPAMSPGLAQSVMQMLAASPVSQVAAGAGAGAGSYAANEAAPGSVFADIAGMLAGAGLAGGLVSKVKPDPIIAAFDRQKVPISAGLTAGDGAGGRALAMAEAAGLGTTIGGSGLVRGTYDKAITAAGQGVDDIARTLGSPQAPRAAGEMLQASVARFMDDKADEAAKAFDAIGQTFGPNDVYVPKTTLQTLAKSFDGIDDPALQAITRDGRFQKFAAAFLDDTGAPKALSYNTLKGFRSFVGRQMNKLALDSGADNAQLKALYGALTGDMEAALLAKGGGAALKAFRDANTWYTRQMETARNSLQPLVGKGLPAAPEQAFNVFNQAASAKAGNIGRLKDIYSSLTPTERTDMSASLITRMGQGKDGFSVAKFLTDLSNMSDEAKSLLFRQQFSPDLVSAWDDLTQTVMPQIERTTRNINRSNSGASLAQLGQAGVAVGSLTSEPLTAITAILGPILAAKAMTNPAAVRFMASALARGQDASGIAARVTAILQGQQAPGR